MNTENGKDESRYLRWADTPVLENDKRSYPFELRIEKVVAAPRAGSTSPRSRGRRTAPGRGSPQTTTAGSC
ncbi:hypothetical protein [Streptomyces xantholiticus]|uniref:hypothetical protein n=1 Tax=Streptomyces xantholiticus TaxID=68285 RepID=UPI001671F19D|nr:hypothetical protein [Streptomyces xantholiticus]GGW43663.1 hypothetical protein GCM10010381_30920 [Streptomyces xantholiticus]